MAIVYLANPNGFVAGWKRYLDEVVEKLESRGHQVINPWKCAQENATVQALFRQLEEPLSAAHLEIGRRIQEEIGRENADGIRRADIVLAIIDGTEPDSGTVVEVGFGVGLGKKAFGLRTDFRDVGELPGVAVNLQLAYFIESSGGRIFRAIDDIDVG